MDETTFDEWIDIFNPEENLIDENALFGGLLFAPHGAECKYVAESHPNRIWTYHLDSHGNKTIIKGFLSEGALGYFLCERNDSSTILAIRDVEDREING